MKAVRLLYPAMGDFLCSEELEFRSMLQVVASFLWNRFRQTSQPRVFRVTGF
jgi:hypothetical protein